jgi:uncharacterized protein (TIGR01777 family)
MKVVIPGGTGQIGRVLVEALRGRGDEVVVLSRGGVREPGTIAWDGRTLGPWAKEVDGADAVINLAGRSVNCRYHKSNLTEMLASRIDSTRAVAQAIAAAARPPRVWLQASTATIYAHRFDAPNDEASGVIGGHEPDVPGYWRYSIEIAEAWERELASANTPSTRRVAMRMAIVMAPDQAGTFGILHRLARLGLGGPIAGGAQYVSWIHDRDLARAVAWLLDRDDVEGAVNLAAPEPLPQRDFMRALREAPVASTRKVLLRSAVTMSPDAGGPFDVLLGLVRHGLGGAAGDGRQFVSWVHHEDFTRAVRWLIDHDGVEGAVNIAAPEPLPNAEFMRVLRAAAGVPIGLGGARWMMEIAAFLHRTDTELLLKSRRVVPARLLDAGFAFEFPSWPAAARDLVARYR